MAYKNIAVEAEDHICIIRLNRPEAMNAISDEMLKEIVEALREAEAERSIRCTIITGSEKVFAAGADIGQLGEMSFVDIFTTNLHAAEGDQIALVRKPVIAAVAGWALGAGLELAMMCDFIIAADTARFGLPEINLGLIPGLGGSQRLTRLVGKSKAMEMMLTGRFMEADEAERTGLVSRVVPAKKLMEEAQEAADKIADKSSLAVMAAKEAANRAYETTLAEGLLHERRLFQALFATEDRNEGIQAFLDKREPQFRDK